MNSAIEVIANVQRVLVRWVIVCFLLLRSVEIVIGHFHRVKKKSSASRQAGPAALDEPLRPGLRAVEGLHSHQDGEQRALGEERAHLLRRVPRGTLGQVDEVAPGAAHALADLRVVARRPALEHQHESVPVGHDGVVRFAHGAQRLQAGLATRGLGEDGVEVIDRALGGRQVELLLRPEEAEQVGLRDAGRAGDVLGRGAVQPLDGELVRRGVEDRGAALVCGLAAGRRPHHGSKYSLTTRACQAWAEAQTNGPSAAATRSHSASVIVAANGSARARANARSAPGKEPRSR